MSGKYTFHFFIENTELATLVDMLIYLLFYVSLSFALLLYGVGGGLNGPGLAGHGLAGHYHTLSGPILLKPYSHASQNIFLVEDSFGSVAVSVSRSRTFSR